MIKNRVVKNASWIIGCKILQSILNLIVGMITARYLGPSNYGLISYAASIVAFVVPLMKLGLQAVLVQEIVNDQEKEGEILGSSLVLNIVSSIFCIVAVIGFVCFSNKGEPITITVCIIYSFSIFFQAIEMIAYWFQAKLLSKYSSIVTLLAYVAVLAYKIYLLVSSKNIYWFAFTQVLNCLLIAIGLIVVYLKKSKNKLSFSLERAKKLFTKSKFFIISSMMIVVFQNTDKLMIKNMLNEASVGYYSAAIAIAGIFGFVFTAIIDSANPIIVESKKINNKNFENNVSSLYSTIFYLAVAQSFAMTLMSDLMVVILYGEEYAPAANVLKICVWQCAFSYFGTIRNIWMWVEKKYKYIWIIDVSGAILNVLANYFLIPILGINGAALASFMTQFFSNFILGFILKPIRRNNILLLKGCNPKYFIQFIKSNLVKLKKESKDLQ